MGTFWKRDGFLIVKCEHLSYLFLSPACAYVLDVVGIRAACLFYRRYWYFGHCPLPWERKTTSIPRKYVSLARDNGQCTKLSVTYVTVVRTS